MRIAFVVQRYGQEVSGGAEFLCRALAERVARSHEVEVITTAALDYRTWEGHYEPGLSTLNGVKVRRFPVDTPRHERLFERASAKVFNGRHTLQDEADWMNLQGPLSPRLLRFLEENRDQYDLFVFFTYLYCTTCLGLPLVADRAILVPTAHDEPPIYLQIFEQVFQTARRLIFLSPEEQFFVARRFCFPELKGEVAGIGLDLAAPAPNGGEEWDNLRRRLSAGPTLTYVGRLDESKGCRTLIDYFRDYLDERPACQATLLFLGRAAMQVPDHPRIIQAGFVSEAVKSQALRTSRLTVAPSPYESLCISALESWAARTPVLANGLCDTLRGQCSRSNGGLWYRNYDEFRECLDRLLGDDALCAALGGQGYGYVRDHYSWQDVEGRYLGIFESLHSEIAGTS